MPESPGTIDRYSRVAVLLHWSIALLVLANLVTGFYMEGLTGPIRRSTISFHVSSGISVLALTVLRVVWRLTHDPPPYPADMRGWERHAASLVHVALYVIMVVMPLSGWALVSANPPAGSAGATATTAARAQANAGSNEGRRQPPPARRLVWGVVPLPYIHSLEQLGSTPDGAVGQKVLHDDIVQWHSLGAFLTIGLLLLHVAGALKHQFMDRQAGFARMWPSRG